MKTTGTEYPFLSLFIVAQKLKRNYNNGMNELQQLRKELGITQVQAANLCGVSRRTYQTYEETNNNKDAANILYEKLKEIGFFNGPVYGKKFIKETCSKIFANYPEIECAFLYGSYARGEAKPESDIDILVVCPAMGMKFFSLAGELSKAFSKDVDLKSHRQAIADANFLGEVLKDGIKIYGK